MNKILCDNCVSRDVCKYVDEFKQIDIETTHPYVELRCKMYVSHYKYGSRESKRDNAKVVSEWRQSNPNGRKIQCARDTGLSRPTVDNYWDGVRNENNN